MNQQEETNKSEEIKVFFSKSLRVFPKGVVITAQRKEKNSEEHIDVVVSNEDIADIYNTINGESPFDTESNEL